jgi:hypothetical protein
MRLQIVGFAALLSAIGIAPALAQDLNDQKSFNVNANFNIQMPLQSGAPTSDMAKAIAQLSQQLGDLASRECVVLSDVFKADCHVSQLNLGSNVNDRRNRQDGMGGEPQRMVNANVQATFTLTPNATAPKASPTSTP